MRFGQHTRLVEEVIDFARYGNILVGPYRGNASDVMVETSFLSAMELARTQDPVEGYAVWGDLISLVMSKVRAQRSRLVDTNLVNEELPRLGDELHAIVKSRLGRGPQDEIMDEVSSDLYHCAYKRAVLGDAPHFFETLYQCYIAGGWPCGWKGEYPAGTLVVYSPNL